MRRPPRTAVERGALRHRRKCSRERREDCALARGELEWSRADPSVATRQLDTERPDASNEPTILAPAQQHVHACDQLVRFEWLRETVVTPELKEPDSCGDIVAWHQSQDREILRFRRITEALASGCSRSPVNEQVENHDVRRGLRRPTNRVVCARYFVNHESRPHQTASDKAVHRRVVLYDERGYRCDRCQHHFPAGPPWQN